MPAAGGGGTEVLEAVEPQSLKKLSLKSLKRAVDVFAPAHGDRIGALSEGYGFYSCIHRVFRIVSFKRFDRFSMVSVTGVRMWLLV